MYRYCGNSGDAVGGPTHVHFGHYLPSGQAVDTMSDLIGWLEAAERRAGVSERRAEAARSTTTVVPTYPHELGAESTFTVSSPVVTAGLSTARRSAAPSATDVLALAMVLAARLLLIPGRRVARRWSLVGLEPDDTSGIGGGDAPASARLNLRRHRSKTSGRQGRTVRARPSRPPRRT
jgi:hypothetical protein